MERGTPVGNVSDEAWARLAGGNAHLDAREARVIRRSALSMAAALVVATCVWALGLITPHLNHGNSSGATMDPTAHTAQYDFHLINPGLWSVTVVGVSTDLPGVVVTSMTPTSLTVAPGSSRPLSMALRVRDCTTAAHAVGTHEQSTGLPMRVSVSRPWGTATTNIEPPDSSWIKDLVLSACGQGTP